MLDLITIGDSLVDIFFIIDEKNSNCHLDRGKKHLCFNYAQKMYIEQSTHDVGGNAANVAVGARKLGLKTAIVTEIGDDINGQVVLDTLTKAQVDVSHVHIHKGQETRYSVVLNYASERTILSYHAPRKYSLPALADTKWIYYTSLGQHFDILQKKLITFLAAHPDTKLALNPGSYQITKGLKQLRPILPHVSLLMVNKEEAAILAEKTTRTNITTLLTVLKNKGIETVVITDSIRGAYAVSPEGRYVMPPYPIEAKAKTGAGDAFTSGFLSAQILGKSLAECMQWGTANAAGVIQEFGAQKGLRTKKGLASIIDSYKKIVPQKV